MNENVKTEELHKEIDLIQGCINRMAQNSFLIKGWTVTLFTVVLALLPEKVEQNNRILLGVVMLAISIMFWYMDSFFLATEKNYRKVYSWVLQERLKNNRQLMYELNFKKYEIEANLSATSLCEVAFAKTLKYFYGIPTVISAAYLIIQFVQICPCQGG